MSIVEAATSSSTRQFSTADLWLKIAALLLVVTRLVVENFMLPCAAAGRCCGGSHTRIQLSNFAGFDKYLGTIFRQLSPTDRQHRIQLRHALPRVPRGHGPYKTDHCRAYCDLALEPGTSPCRMCSTELAVAAPHDGPAHGAATCSQPFKACGRELLYCGP